MDDLIELLERTTPSVSAPNVGALTRRARVRHRRRWASVVIPLVVLAAGAVALRPGNGSPRHHCERPPTDRHVASHEPTAARPHVAGADGHAVRWSPRRRRRQLRWRRARASVRNGAVRRELRSLDPACDRARRAERCRRRSARRERPSGPGGTRRRRSGERRATRRSHAAMARDPHPFTVGSRLRRVGVERHDTRARTLRPNGPNPGAAGPPTLERWSADTNTWRHGASPPTAPRFLAAVARTPHRLAVWGGYTFDPHAPKTVPVPVAVDGTTPTTAGSGIDRPRRAFTDGAIYDIDNDSWTYLPPEPSLAEMATRGEEALLGASTLTLLSSQVDGSPASSPATNTAAGAGCRPHPPRARCTPSNRRPGRSQ